MVVMVNILVQDRAQCALLLVPKALVMALLQRLLDTFQPVLLTMQRALLWVR